MITLKDISIKVGKSITTVSRALNGYADVSLETKKLVWKIAEEMGYHSNIIAQHLQKQKTDTLGFIIPTFGPRFSDPFFSEFLAGVGNMASDLDFDLFVYAQSRGQQQRAVFDHLRARVVSDRMDLQYREFLLLP